ncbi:NADH-quinone oxidoreductase subunit M [Phytohabitans flavus]|uniref:NADH-quinone oxidoreductase subunit M n=1 Tax=Phytohabitans flavus TaxID=1076124 RepID=A0A6F8Y5H4_9ACTN|nr:NADH-quinone oxidoreductase subunit M [Phytohabitans flavus]
MVAVLAVPAAGALLAAFLPSRAGQVAGTVAAAVTLALSVPLYRDSWFSYGPAAVRPWHEVDLTWVPGLDLRFHLGVDGVSYPLVVLTGLLTLLCCAYTLWRAPAPGLSRSRSLRSLAAPGGRRDPASSLRSLDRILPALGRGHTLVALLLVIEVGILGTFLALDLVLFFVFFEVVLLPMYAVIAVWGGDDRAHAARKFVLYTLFGSVLLLVGVFTVVVSAGTADIVALTGGGELSRGTQIAAFVLLAIAFAVKSPLWPLHTWLPDAHTQAPTVGSVILAGVLLKMGTYGLIRVGVGVAPEGARWAAPVLGILAVAAIVAGSLVCLAQTEIKRLIAYSSVGHMGFVLLGIATLTTTGIQAALIGNVAHGVITGLLFFLAGAIKERAHTGELAQLGGLREQSPWLAGLLAFAAIASLGLPGLAGFWGEAFAVVASLDKGGPLWTTLAAVAAVGGALTAAYFLRLLRRVTHGPAVGVLDPPGLARAEVAAWAPLVLLALVVGLLPALVLGMAGDPVGALVEAVGS